MKTFKPNFDQFAVDRLRHEILEKIGWSITNKPDCSKLSDLILESGLGIISESTLYRLFFQFEKHSPYKSTLDILCKFLDYEDSMEFIEKLAEYRVDFHYNGVNTSSRNKKTLVFTCIENTAKKPLFDFFEAANELTPQFKTDVSVSIFDSLLLTTRQNWFFKNFSGQRYIREYLFEYGHDPKFRIPNYDKAYTYYLDGVNPESDVSHLQDYLFGNCVLFRHYFVSKRAKEAVDFGTRLYGRNLLIEGVRNELNIFPYIRYTAYKLWYLELTNSSQNELIDYASFLIDLCSKMKPGLSFIEKRIVLHTVAETFIESNLPELFHWNLKDVFDEMYHSIPPGVYQKHLKYSLPYFNQNAFLNFRP